MNKQNIRKLRALAKEKGLRGYYKLNMADIIALLSK